jgi:multisubunit Na+/H+ antiporter MnhB subunit
MPWYRKFFYGVIIVLVLIVNILLLQVVMEMPRYGDTSNPTQNYVIKRYLEKGVEESGGYNIVSNILLDYRGFDTFLETTVIFSAVVAVTLTLAVLRGDQL